MFNMKYITFEGPYHQEIVIFANSVKHDQMLYKLGINREDVLGAGFIDFETNTCYGESIGLGIKARKIEDSAIFFRLSGQDQ
jgi:hypothetical protein